MPGPPRLLFRRLAWTPGGLAPCLLVALLVGGTLLFTTPASAQEASERPYQLTGSRVGWGLAGVVTGFVTHEAAHVLANLTLGNVPRFNGIWVWGAIPFFAIEPNIDCYGDDCFKRNGDRFRPGRRGKFFIVTAGFNAQHVANEVMLSLDPELHHHVAPFRKGWLLFNVFLSCLYAAGAWTGLEAPNGDLGGAADMSQFNEIALSFALLAPTAVDVYRYFVPSSVRWTPWVARSAKLMFFGLTFTF